MSGLLSKINSHAKKQKIKTLIRGGNQSIKRNPDVAEMMEFIGGDVTIAIRNMLHMCKKDEECTVREMKAIKKVTNGTLRHENLIFEMKNMLDRVHSRVNTEELTSQWFEATKMI